MERRFGTTSWYEALRSAEDRLHFSFSLFNGRDVHTAEEAKLEGHLIKKKKPKKPSGWEKLTEEGNGGGGPFLNDLCQGVLEPVFV